MIRDPHVVTVRYGTFHRAFDLLYPPGSGGSNAKKKKKGNKNGTVLLTDWPPTNWAGSRLPGIFGLFAVG